MRQVKSKMAHRGGTAWGEQHHMREEGTTLCQRTTFRIQSKMPKRSTKHEALQTCENAQTTYIKEAKPQSAEQLGKEQAKRMNAQRTEDEHQCVNKAEFLRHCECDEDQQSTKPNNLK